MDPIPASQVPADTPSPTHAHQYVETSRLKCGLKLKFPIRDTAGVLLLAEGLIITEAFLNGLRIRGMTQVQVHESEIPRICAGFPQGTATEVPADRCVASSTLSNAATDELDTALLRGQLGLPRQGPAFATELQQHGAMGYSEELKEEFVTRQSAAVKQIQGVFQNLVAGHGLDVATLSQVTEQALQDMRRDSDLFALLGINPFAEGYPARHSMHVCMLAIAIGTHLRLDAATLKELAVGCLIHDSGMQRLKKQVYERPKILSPVEFLEITKHPIIVFDMMKEMRAVSQRSAFIAYQMHERCNGTGYPRRQAGHQIHFLSKVAAVADAYVGLVSPRPHRPALLPYYGVEKLLYGVRDGLFEPSAVKALLQTISLFPLGSYVQLSDGRVGRVIRSRPESFATPIVETWAPEDLWSDPEIVDLSDARVRVVGPLASLKSAGEPLCEVPTDSTRQAEDLVSHSDKSNLREHPRFELQQQITVYPCPQGVLTGSEVPFPAMMKDLSQGGVGFECDQFLASDHLVIEIPSQTVGVSLLVQVRRSMTRPNGQWEYGAAIVRRLPAQWKKSLTPAQEASTQV